MQDTVLDQMSLTIAVMMQAMTGVAGAHEEEWSAMTLAIFQDSGFYDVDYSLTSSDFEWGRVPSLCVCMI